MYSKEIKNVIVLMTDSLQYNYLGCYGNDWIKTPNYDRFAQQSTLFENNYTECVPTVPCRRAMFTGRHGLPFLGWSPLRQEDTTLTDILWGSGLQTALIYDTAPMRLPKYGFSRGFDHVDFTHGQEMDVQHWDHDTLYGLKPEDFIEERSFRRPDGTLYDEGMLGYTMEEMANLLKHRQHWRGDQDHQIAVVTRKAIDHLENHTDHSRPFFMWIDSFDPHEPYDPPSVYNPDMDCPYNPGYKGKDQINQIPGMVGDRYSDEELHHIHMLYAEKVTMVDKWVGHFLDHTRQMGLWDNTMIILVSDHGKPMGNGKDGHGLMRMWRPWPYEELVHAPLLIRTPGMGEGRRVKSFAQSCDMAPTILDWLGMLDNSNKIETQYVEKNSLDASEMTGHSLLPLVSGEKEKVRDFAIAGYYGFSWSIITDSHSYIHWLPDSCESSDEYADKMYDGEGLDAGRRTKGLQTDDMFTCTPGAETTVPDRDELYDRREDIFQLNNIIDQQPEVAKELLVKLKLYMGELRTS